MYGIKSFASGGTTAEPSQSDPWAWNAWQRNVNKDPLYNWNTQAPATASSLSALKPYLQQQGKWTPELETAMNAYQPIQYAGSNDSGQLGGDIPAQNDVLLSQLGLDGYQTARARSSGYNELQAILGPDNNPVAGDVGKLASSAWNRSDYIMPAMVASAGLLGPLTGYYAAAGMSPAMAAAGAGATLGAGTGAISGGTQGALKGALLGGVGGYMTGGTGGDPTKAALYGSSGYGDAMTAQEAFNAANAASPLNNFDPNALNGFDPTSQLKNVGTLDASGTMPSGLQNFNSQFPPSVDYSQYGPDTTQFNSGASSATAPTATAPTATAPTDTKWSAPPGSDYGPGEQGSTTANDYNAQGATTGAASQSPFTDWLNANPALAAKLLGVVGGGVSKLLGNGSGSSSSTNTTGAPGTGPQSNLIANSPTLFNTNRQYNAPPKGYRPGFDPEWNYFTGIGSVNSTTPPTNTLPVAPGAPKG